MKTIPLETNEADVSKFVQLANDEDVVFTTNGRPTAMLIGIEPEDDEFDQQLENDPRFAVCIAAARDRIRQGLGVKLEDIVFDD